MPADTSDHMLVDRIRRGEPQAWEDFIGRYEGRLLAFAESRVGRRAAAEDIVQEALLGFLVSLPNYDESTPLESWLFSITAHKLTDHLRREGRRSTIPLYLSGTTSGYDEPPGDARAASSLARSQERRVAEQQVIGRCLRALIDDWKRKGEFERLECVELLFVLGLPNKDVATRLGLSEQAVANHKHFVIGKLKDAAAQARLRDFDLRELGIET